MTETIAPGLAEQRHAERHEGDVDVLGLLRLVRLAGEQVERDEQEQQTARDHQRGDGDMQVVEDLMAEEPEDRDHAEGDAHGLEGHLLLHLGGSAGGEPEEDRGDPGGSMMTKRVRKSEPKTATSNTVMALQRESYEDAARKGDGEKVEVRTTRRGVHRRPARGTPRSRGA